MADGFSVELKGLKEVDERLVLLGAVAGEKVMRSTLFVAVKPIMDQAIANAAAIPTGSGALAKSIRRVYLKPTSRLTSLTGGSGSKFTVAVAPKTKDRTAVALANLYYGRKKPIRKIIWGHLVEWGHRIGNKNTGRLTRATTAKGLLRTRLHGGLGRVPGKLIFTRAAQSRAAEAIEIFRNRIGKAIDRALKRQQPE